MVELREVIPVIVLVALGMLLFVTISEQWTENESAESDQLEYLDCKPLSDFGNVVTFSGPGEVFNYGGEDWIRFTDVGELSVLTTEGSRTYTVTKAKLGLIVISGQSNSVMGTHPQYFTTPYTIDPGKVFIFGTEDVSGHAARGCAAIPETVGESKIVDLVYPDGTLRQSQMYPVFCKDYLEESGKRFIVLNTGISGKEISCWDIPTGECAAWMTTAIDFMNRVIEEDGRIEVEPLAVLWSQGESDFDQTEEYYLDRFETLVERLEDGTWGYKFPKVLTILPRHRGNEEMIPPVLAQLSLAETDDTVIVASSLPPLFGADASGYTRDGVHYTQKVFGWLGEALAITLATAEGYEPVPETIVFMKPLGEVHELPSTVTAYGTTGKAFELQVAWTESGDSYVGELSGNPIGTRILSGLSASATLIPYEYDSATSTFTLYASMDAPESWGDAADAENLIIRDGVTTIAAGMFADFASLMYISIPESLATIGDGAFGVTLKDCFDETIAEPGAGEYVGDGDGILYLADGDIYTYSGSALTGLTTEAASAKIVVLPISYEGTAVASIKSSAFASSSIEKVMLLPGDYSLTALGASAFSSCGSLVDARLPDSVAQLPYRCFYGCTSLATVSMPSVTSMGTGALQGCTSLDIDLPESIADIGGSAFANCTSLTALHFPATTETLESFSFSNCTGVTSVSFAEGFAPTTLHINAFRSWTFYDSDGTTVLERDVASNLAGFTFVGSATALVKQS